MAWNTLSCKTLCKMMSASGRERKSERKTEEGHRHTWKYDRGRDRVEIKALARVHVCPMCVFVFKLAWCRHNSRDLQKTLNTDHHWYDHKWHTPIPKQPNQTTAYHTKPNGNGMKLEKERKKWKKKEKNIYKTNTPTTAKSHRFQNQVAKMNASYCTQWCYECFKLLFFSSSVCLCTYGVVACNTRACRKEKPRKERERDREGEGKRWFISEMWMMFENIVKQTLALWFIRTHRLRTKKRKVANKKQTSTAIMNTIPEQEKKQEKQREKTKKCH